MKILVTGGAGFIGRRLVQALLERGQMPDGEGRERRVETIRISDVAEPLKPFPDDPRIETSYGDFSDPDAAQMLASGCDLVFHLAAIVSGQAEQEFDLGMRINLDGTRGLLEACRAGGRRPRLVFASSVAAYGGDLPDVIRDDTPANPQTSYGAQKAISELLVSDYSRKGFVDGRALRLPTIVVRPGKPNAAASSFASSIVREPMQGDLYECPVSVQTGVWILSPRRVVEAFVHAATLPESGWDGKRVVMLPGISVTLSEVLAAMAAVGGREVVDRVSFKPDPFIEKIVYGWPVRFAPERALSMGFKADDSFESVVRAFVEDELGGRAAGS